MYRTVYTVPSRRFFNIVKHLLYVYPLKRSFRLIRSGESKYIGYPILIGIVRFFYMVKGILVGK